MLLPLAAKGRLRQAFSQAVADGLVALRVVKPSIFLNY